MDKVSNLGVTKYWQTLRFGHLPFLLLYPDCNKVVEAVMDKGELVHLGTFAPFFSGRLLVSMWTGDCIWATIVLDRRGWWPFCWSVLSVVVSAETTWEVKQLLSALAQALRETIKMVRD